MSTVTLGGERLGSGNKNKVELHNFSRSTHDLSYVWRSTMAAGTLVPFMSEVGLPGDTFDIDLDCDIKTHPTIGPLFGSYKVQLDVFSVPIRLYNGKLHMNLLNIGLKMQDIKLPLINMFARNIKTGDNSQINASCIYSYLNMRGVGYDANEVTTVGRKFNAIPYLAYWDIYKQYYANVVEEIGAVIHNGQDYIANELDTAVPQVIDNGGIQWDVDGSTSSNLTSDATLTITMTTDQTPNVDYVYIDTDLNGNPIGQLPWSTYFQTYTWNEGTKQLILATPTQYAMTNYLTWMSVVYNISAPPNQEQPNVVTFPLAHIDQMRETILAQVYNPAALEISQSTLSPYGLPLNQGDTGKFSMESSQEGLALKTYQSDLFNNWISTEWIDGVNGINAITSVDTSSGEFSIDTLQLSKKVYDMLNRIAVSGGTYDDWLDAVYTHERTRSVESPVYQGGLIKELAFQEVVSTTASDTNIALQPLGTLAGRGTLTGKNKGGKVRVRIDEPSYIMGIISLTPRVDYSQGNKWDVNLKTMDDFHKPSLDQIGFQDLLTDQMAWWDTEIVAGVPVYKSAGKQPAWINYMTNVNVTRGNFAEQSQQMFMTLNRRYEQDGTGIKDLTTYIDPSKFNNIFADTRLDAQNFWAQIGVRIQARRKMSAKLMPNL